MGKTTPAKNETKPREINLPALSLALSLLSLITVPFGMESKSPPEFYPAWALTWTIAGAAVLVGLIGARQAHNVPTRILSGAAIVVACLASGFALNFFHASYHDYPVPVFGPALVVLVVALAFCRLKSLSVALAALLIFFLYGAFLPPIGGSHRSVTKDTLTVTVDATNGRKLIVQGPIGTDLSALYDLDNIEVEGRIGPLIPVYSWPPRTIDQGGSNTSSHRTMFLHSFVPSWTRSWDAKISIPAWPNDSEVQLVVDTRKQVDHSGSKVENGNAGGYSLAISNVRWTIEKDPHPPGPCLHMTIACKAPGVGGFSHNMLRATDPSGHALHLMGGNWDGDRGDFEIYPIDKQTKQVRIDLYSQDSRRTNRIVFDFPRLANR